MVVQIIFFFIYLFFSFCLLSLLQLILLLLLFTIIITINLSNIVILLLSLSFIIVILFLCLLYFLFYIYLIMCNFLRCCFFKFRIFICYWCCIDELVLYYYVFCSWYCIFKNEKSNKYYSKKSLWAYKLISSHKRCFYLLFVIYLLMLLRISVK